MKKLLLFCLGLAFVPAFGQADVSIRMVSPQSGDAIVAGNQFQVQAVIKNVGTEPIDAQDTVIYQPFINGGAIGDGQGGVLFYAFTGASIAPGDSSLRPANPLALSGGSSGNWNFCTIVLVRGAGWTGVMEADTSNNTDCAAVTYDAGSMSSGEWSVAQREDNSYYHGGTFFVALNNYELKDYPQLRVVNLLGAEVMNTAINQRGNQVYGEVSLNKLKRGIYVVQITKADGSAISTRKIFVE